MTPLWDLSGLQTVLQAILSIKYSVNNLVYLDYINVDANSQLAIEASHCSSARY